MTVRATPLLLLFAAASPAAAQVAHEGVVWTTVAASAPVSREVDLSLELNSRYVDDVSRAGQFLIRSGVIYRPIDRVALAGGYVYTRVKSSNGRIDDEHRAWQQLTLTLLDVQEGPTLTARTRLEQRFREVFGSDAAWRLREQVRAQIPMRPGSSTALFVAHEWLVHLNDASWGARAGVEQVRTAAGVNLPLNDRLRFEPSYLNIVNVRPGEDNMQHVLNINVAWRL